MPVISVAPDLVWWMARSFWRIYFIQRAVAGVVLRKLSLGFREKNELF